VLALSGGEITQEAVRRVLGLVEEERYLALLDLLQDGRHGAVFGFVQTLMDEGYDLSEFYSGLLDNLRTLLRLRLSPEEPIPEMSEHLRSDFLARCKAYDPRDLVRMLSLASELEASGSLRRSGNPRLLLEMLLLRLSYLDRTVELEEVLRGLGGAPPGDPPVPPAGTSAADPALSREVPDEASPTTPPAGGSVQEGKGDAPARRPPRDVEEAWVAAVNSAGGLPGMVAGLLRGGTARREGNTVRVTVEAAALEHLKPIHEKALCTALAEVLNEGVELEVSAAPTPDAGSGRISQHQVRGGRLKELIREEPALEHAVRELDLELLD
jgi:DNA polymerase-3 subunit gamma/tau